MRIFVIEDTESEQEAALSQLGGYGLPTFAATFKMARRILEESVGEPFDVVLTDLMMPGESVGLSHQGEAFVGEPTPYGLVLALLAKKVGTAKVAIVSNGNHHDHPIFWACDALSCHAERDGIQVVPGLWVFTGYECPMTETTHRTKDWRKVFTCITERNA